MKLYKKMNSSNTALLVIDIVNGCCHKKCEEPKWGINFSKIREMVPELKRFIEEYRKTVGGLIVFGNITSWRKEFLTENINELYTDPIARYYSDDTSGFSEQFYMVSPQEEDLVFTKNHYDMFTNEEFCEVIEKKGIRYFIVSGVFGDGCVLSTIVSGFSRGYNFVILKDLIETTDVKTRQTLQKLLKEYTWPVMYGKTMNSSEFLKAWNK